MASNERAGFRFTPQAIIGALVVFWGLTLTADNLGWLPARRVLRFWPGALVLLGLAMYRRARDRGGQLSAAVVIFVGGWLTLGVLLGWHFNLAVLWSIALVVLGGVMIVRAQDRARTGGETTDRQFSDFAFWSGIKRRITSSAFKGADFTAVMGGGEVDLRGAGIGDGGAVIDVFIVMGGMEIRVPPDWAVSNEVMAVMAGVDDKTTGTQESKNRLVVRGFVMMGGIEIKT